MPDANIVEIISGGVINLPQNGQETVIYQLPQSGEISFGFDTENAIFSADGGNLVISVENVGSVILEGYQALAQSGTVPTMALMGGEVVPGDVYLFVFNNGEDIQTAADGSASGSGAGAYTDGSGTLYHSLDRLGEGSLGLTGGGTDGIRRGLSDADFTEGTNANAPTINGQLSITMEEDGTYIIYDTDILSLVSDPDPGTFLGVTSLTISGGTLTEVRDAAGNLQYWTFEPEPDFNGELDINFTVSDTVFTASGTGTVEVLPVNDAPVVEDADTLTMDEDGTITIKATDLLANASDVDGDDLSVSAVTLAEGTQGELTDNGNGTWTFTPDDDWNGTVEYSFTVTDGQGGSESASGSIVVEAVNDAPELSFSAKDIGNNLIVNGSFEDADIASGDWAQGHTPNGWLKLEGDRWEVMSGDRYGIPGATDGENVVDFGVGSRQALMITQTVNGLTEGEYVLELDLFDRGSELGHGDSGAIDVIWNGVVVASINPGDDAWETRSITIQVPENVTSGTLVLAGNESINFGNVIDNVRLYQVGEPADDTVTVVENAEAGTVIATALASDIDNTAGELTFSLAEGTPFVIDPTTGVITVAEGADIDFETLNTYALEVSVTDGELTTTKTLTVNVSDVNEMFTSADVTLDDINEDGGSITFTAEELIGSAVDPDGDTISVTSVSLAEGEGTLTANADGSWTFTPDENWSGDVSFDYTLSDGQFTADHSATMTVLPVNDAPTLNFSTGSGAENLLINGSFEDVPIESGDWAQGHIPEGWTKVEGDRWEVMSGERFGIEGATDGDNVIDFGVGSRQALVISQTIEDMDKGEYVLELDLFDRGSNLGGNDSGTLAVYWNGELVGTYNPGDEAWETASIVVQIAEDGTDGVLTLASYDNDGYGNVVDNVRLYSAGLAENDTVTVTENTEAGTVVATALAADVDNAAGDLTFSLAEGTPFVIDPNTGVITVAEGADIDFETQNSYALEVSVTDGDLTTTRTLTVNVGNVNEPFTSDDVSLGDINEDGGAFTFSAQDLIGGAIDQDGDLLTVEGLTLAQGEGTLITNEDGSWTFTPADDWSGNVSFNYTLTDGEFTADHTADLTVVGVNDAPLLSFATGLGGENLITNGSFEDVAIANEGWASEKPDGWELVAGNRWELLDGNYVYVGGASDGENVLDLAVHDGAPMAVMQTIDNLSEGEYVITLDLFDRKDYSHQGDGESVDVYWNGELVGSYNPGDEWGTVSLVVTVGEDETSGDLMLASRNAEMYGNLMDNVTMHAVGATATTVEINEGVADGTYIATALGSDVDSTDLTFAITDEDSPFTIDPETGVITVANGSILDGMESYDIHVSLTDGDGGVTTSTLTVEVNEPPVGTDFTVEAAGAGQTVINFTDDVNVFDADGDVTGITIAETPDPAAGTLYFNGDPVEAGETYRLADGTFTFEANPTAGTTLLLGSKDGSDLGLTNWGADSDKVNTDTLTQEVNGNTITVQSGYGVLSGNASDGYSFAVDLDRAGKHLKQYDENANHVGFGIGDKDGYGIQSGESVTVDFGDMLVTNATIGFDGLGSHFDEGGKVDAKAVWIAMLDGEVVGSGAIQSEGGNGHLYEELTITSDMIEGGAFDSIVFTTESGSSSNWELRFVEAESNVDASFDYIPVDDDNLPAGEESTVTIDIQAAAGTDSPESGGSPLPETDPDPMGLDLGGTEAVLLSEGGHFTNMLGIYFVENGEPSNPEIILANSQDADMLNNVLKTFGEDTEVHFFLISDADGQGITDEDILSQLNFVMNDGEWALAMGDKIVDVRFDQAMFNPAGEEASFRFSTGEDGALIVEVDDQLGNGDDFDAMTLEVGDSDQYGAAWTEGDAPVRIAGDVVITDDGDGVISGATIALTNAQAGDSLNVGDLPDGMSYEITTDGTTITLTLSGDLSVADYQAAIGSVTYAGGDEPSEADRLIEITITDGDGTATATSTISVDDLDVGAQIVLNPSFEYSDPIHGPWDPTDAVEHWSNTSEGSMEIWGEGMNKDAPEGRKHMELDGEHAMDNLSQTIATKAGEPVTISFSFGARPGTAPETNNFDVMLSGVLVATVAWNAATSLYEVTDASGDEITSFAYDGSEHGWTTIEFEAIPTVNHAELSFVEHADGNDSYGAMIDNVQVVRDFDTMLEGTHHPDLLVGTDGDDFILGTDRASIDGAHGKDDKGDEIQGGGGDDAIYAGGGDDLLVGGDGNDFIFGGGGDDTIEGGAGDDYINPGSGDALITTGEGNDIIHIDQSVLTGKGESEIVVTDFQLGTDALELGDGMSVKDIISGTQDSINYTEVLVGDDQGHDVVVKLLGVSKADLSEHQTPVEAGAGHDDLIQFLIDSGNE